jgi:signal transduction histidine kinase/ligand-binding sensor domain-containing protein
MGKTETLRDVNNANAEPGGFPARGLNRTVEFIQPRRMPQRGESQRCRNILRMIASVTLTAFLSAVVAAQLLPFRYYSMKNGLPSNQVTCILQDSKGFLWIGTSEGLSIYDGDSFSTYSPQNGLSFGFVTDIIEDRGAPGTMWIATNGGGLRKLSDGQFTAFHPAERKPGDFVSTLMQDRSGTVWCGSDSGVFLVRAGIISSFHEERGFRGVKTIVETDDNTVWISCESGLFRYTRSPDMLRQFDIGEPDQRPEQLCQDAAGSLWVSTLHGSILEIRGQTILRRYRTGLKSVSGYDTFNSLMDDGKGTLWACTRLGLLAIPKDFPPPDRLRWYSEANGLPENRVVAFFIDREENFWIGTLSRGLSKLSDKHVRTFSFPGEEFFAINNSGGLTDEEGHIWIVVSRGLQEIWRDDHGNWCTTYHGVLDSASHEIISGIASDARHWFWLFSYPRTVRCCRVEHDSLRGNTLRTMKRLSLEAEIPWDILSLIVDRRGRIWIGGEKVAVVDAESVPHVRRVFSAGDAIPASSARALFEDHAGNIWIGGGYGDGVSVIANGDWKAGVSAHFTLNDGLPDDYIRAFGEDRAGGLLIGSRFGGLMEFHDGRFSHYTTSDGLLSNGVSTIARDSAGRLYLGTHVGLQRFEKTGSLVFETKRDLMGGPVVSTGIFDGTSVWFQMQGMVVLYEPSLSAPAAFPPPVYVTAVSVNGQSHRTDESPELDASQNDITVNFRCLSYRDEDANRFLYRLLGEQDSWQPAVRGHSVTFAALQPGSYTFQVKAISADGIESGRPDVFSFVILAPVWRRWWFILLANAVLLGLTFLGYRYRMRQLLKIERIRTRIASDLHDDIGASLTRIALFSDVAREEAKSSSPRLVEMADKIGANARELLDSVGTLVWSIDPRHDRFEDVVTYLKNFAQEMLSMKGIDHRFAIDDAVPRLSIPLDARKNILLIFKEAINNIVKHAECSTVMIELRWSHRGLSMVIADDGKGIGGPGRLGGHGLANMQSRAQSIGGDLAVGPPPGGKGTLVQLRLPISE